MTSPDARLVYDSEHTGGQVGARSMVGGDRSLLFSSGSMVVDLVVYEGTPDMRVVHGQVVERDSESPIAGARVRLGAAGDESETDEFGQFHLSTLMPFEHTILSIESEQGEIRCTIPPASEQEEAAR